MNRVTPLLRARTGGRGVGAPSPAAHSRGAATRRTTTTTLALVHGSAVHYDSVTEAGQGSRQLDGATSRIERHDSFRRSRRGEYLARAALRGKAVASKEVGPSRLRGIHRVGRVGARVRDPPRLPVERQADRDLPGADSVLGWRLLSFPVDVGRRGGRRGHGGSGRLSDLSLAREERQESARFTEETAVIDRLRKEEGHAFHHLDP
jgi:hypothetical protein